MPPDISAGDSADADGALDGNLDSVWFANCDLASITILWGFERRCTAAAVWAEKLIVVSIVSRRCMPVSFSFTSYAQLVYQYQVRLFWKPKP